VVPRDSVITGALYFDTPTGKFKRTFDKSTFENMAHYYAITDRKVGLIGKLIHDIEINTWDKKVYRMTGEVEERIFGMIRKQQRTERLIDRGVHFFDSLYESLSDTLSRNR
jgi:hypothetical protein